MKGFLDYLTGNSVLHKMHPLVKIFVSILICAAAFCSSNYYFLIGIIIINILMGAIGNGKEHNGLLSRTLGILKGLVKMSIFLFVLQLLVNHLLQSHHLQSNHERFSFHMRHIQLLV